jgi:hypothetical protein
MAAMYVATQITQFGTARRLRAGADRALVTECQAALGPISRGSPSLSLSHIQRQPRCPPTPIGSCALRAVLRARPDHYQVARFIGPAVGPIPVMKVPVRCQTAVGPGVEIAAAFHDAGRFREELRDAPQLSGIIRDDRHLAQFPERPIFITGLTAVIAPQVHREQVARSRSDGAEPARRSRADIRRSCARLVSAAWGAGDCRRLMAAR